MAGIVSEQYEWQPTVKIGDTLLQNARVRIWDNDGDSIVNLLTNVSGQIVVQNLIQAIHSITLTDTVSSNDETPHRIRTLFIGNADLDSPNGKYATVVDQFNKDLGQVSSLNTIFLDVDDFVTHTKTVIAAYTGIGFTHGSTLISLTVNHSILEIYEFCVNENYDNPQYATAAIMATNDGNVFQSFYSLTIATGITLTSNGGTISLASGKVLTFTGTANFIGGLSVGGDVDWGSITTINNLNATGTVDLSVAGIYTVSNCNWGDITNSSGGAITINATNCTFPVTPTGPNITVVTGQRTFSFTVNPSITGYEWRLYSVTAVGSLAGSDELDGEEVATQDNQSYPYTYTVDQPIAVQIIDLANDIIESITYYTLIDGDQPVTINVKEDTNN